MYIRPSRVFTSVEAVCSANLACRSAILNSIGAARFAATPYPHLTLTEVLPPYLIRALVELPFAQPTAPVLGCDRPTVQARRKLGGRDSHAFAACHTVAKSLQCPELIGAMARASGADLDGCEPRVSLVREIDGYECAPQTQYGAARFTLVVALDTGNQGNLGPDLYFETGDWACQLPWRAGRGFAFAPSPISWHGFEPRMIRSVRTSLVVDYLPTAPG